MSSVATGYKKIMWGILISGLHINIGIGIGVIQVIPAAIGYLVMFMGLKELVENADMKYMEIVQKNAMTMVIISTAFWAYGFLFDYVGVVGRGLGVIVALMELLLFGNMLNMTVKYYKEKEDTKSADSLRTKRMTFIKGYLVLIVLCAIAMIPFEKINGALTLLVTFLDYATTTTMFLAKIWLSLMVQKLANE